MIRLKVNMADYRCYFFGPTAQWFGVPRSIEVAKDLRAESDDEARTVAETMYRERPNQTYGFELWQADRLVLRRLSMSRRRRTWRAGLFRLV